MAIMDQLVSHLRSRHGTLPIPEYSSEELNTKAKSNRSGQDQKSHGSGRQWFLIVGKVFKQISRELRQMADMAGMADV